MREFTGTWMRHSGDFWGGFAAMLVALPASVAFGVTVYSAVSPHYAAFGALAGILGATALGLIAPTFGGTDRLISSPCAPAAAVLTAFAMQFVAQGVEPFAIVLMMTVLGIPVSTTHTKTSAIMGVGAVRRLSAINFGVVRDMMLTWVFTFPGCGLISFVMAKLFMVVF